MAVLCNFPSSDPGGLVQGVGEVYLGDEMAAAEAAAAAAGEGNPTAAGGDGGAPAVITMSEEELAAFAGVYRARRTDRAARISVREAKL